MYDDYICGKKDNRKRSLAIIIIYKCHKVAMVYNTASCDVHLAKFFGNVSNIAKETLGPKNDEVHIFFELFKLCWEANG